MQAWLESYLSAVGAAAGTVHLERDGGELELVAHVRIPPPVLARVERVARGKGMAGLAQVRREPVQTCNLQSDETGRINPTARLVNAQAAVALPVFASDDEGAPLLAVVGAAFLTEGDLPDEQLQDLARLARGLRDLAG